MSSILTRLKIIFGKALADARAITALKSGQHMDVVDDKKQIVFTPKTPGDRGIIFYPGGRCDPRAYTLWIKELANKGWTVIVPRMPLWMPVFDANRASSIIAANQQIRRWAIGGHSMGGVMACAFAARHLELVKGLFFLGSYPAKSFAITDADLPVLMVSGSKDDITRASEVAAAPERLPQGSTFVTIEGGDHYQFGDFASAEITASISVSQQREEVLNALTGFLQDL